MGFDHRIIDAVLAQAAAEHGLSSGSLARFRRRVQRRLDALHGQGVVGLPPESTFSRKVKLLLAGRNTFGPATTREAMANQPRGVYATIEATRPGEIVMLDTSWLDVIAYDPLRDVTFRRNHDRYRYRDRQPAGLAAEPQGHQGSGRRDVDRRRDDTGANAARLA